jgi:hypothetical protein
MKHGLHALRVVLSSAQVGNKFSLICAPLFELNCGRRSYIYCGVVRTLKFEGFVCSEPFVMASEPMSLSDFPDEILLKILSYFESEDLFILAKVCERWNVLAKDVILWKSISYYDGSSDISRIAQVRCTTVLRFRTN